MPLRRAALTAICLSAVVYAFLAVYERSRRNVTDDLHDQEAMRAAVLHAVPIGSTRAAAERFMVQQGFACVPKADATFVDGQQIDFLYCDRMDDAGFPIMRRWQVALIYENNIITDVHVTTGLVGP